MTNKENYIVDYVKKRGQISPHELAQYLQLGAPMVHRYLKDLVSRKILVRRGTPPRVYYSVAEKREMAKIDFDIASADRKVIDANFTLLEADGSEIPGTDGFIQWCVDRKYDPIKKTEEYLREIDIYNSFKKNGFIDATKKIENSFPSSERFLDSLYYLYPYSIPVFGKTKIATWLFHGKQTESKVLMSRVLYLVVPEIEAFITQFDFDAIAIVPPTVPRRIQFMKELKNSVGIKIPIIEIEKIKSPIMIQQKSLKDIGDRIKNAKNTMVVRGTNAQYKKVLLLDDFTGSGSTLNMLAKKIKSQNIAKEVVGLTITGSMNGFDVIKEI